MIELNSLENFRFCQLPSQKSTILLAPIRQCYKSCHTRNCLISLPYCINGLYLTTFLGFKISTNIAVIEILGITLKRKAQAIRPGLFTYNLRNHLEGRVNVKSPSPINLGPTSPGSKGRGLPRLVPVPLIPSNRPVPLIISLVCFGAPDSNIV